jgi:hypothetical protein
MNYITYTRDEILNALKAYQASIAYTKADRDRILNNPNLSKLLDGLKASAKEFLEKFKYVFSQDLAAIGYAVKFE